MPEQDTFQATFQVTLIRLPESIDDPIVVCRRAEGTNGMVRPFTFYSYAEDERVAQQIILDAERGVFCCGKEVMITISHGERDGRIINICLALKQMST